MIPKYKQVINKYPSKSWNVETHGILFYKEKKTQEDATKACMQFLRDPYYNDTAKYVKFEPKGSKITQYSEEMIDKWLSFLKTNFNMNFEYDGQWFTIDKSEVKSGFKMYVTLILIRYLWYPTENIIDETFRILETEPTIDPFIAVQLAHYNSSIHNNTFTLFSSGIVMIPVTTEQLLKDFELCESGKDVIFTVNYYFGFYSFVQNNGDLSNYYFHYKLMNIYTNTIRKYYEQNRFDKCLEVVDTFNKEFKVVSQYNSNEKPVIQTKLLSKDKVLELINSALENYFEAKVSSLKYFQNSTIAVKDFLDIKDFTKYYFIGDQTTIYKLEGSKEYPMGDKNIKGSYLMGRQLESSEAPKSMYPSTFLIFEINE